MPRRKSREDVSLEELRRLLIDKVRVRRRERLAEFQRTGRVTSWRAPQPPKTARMPDTEVDREQSTPPAKRRRRALDGMLLAVELLAVAGLVGVLLSGLSVLRDLNREAAATLKPATADPAPPIVWVVLPSGHTAPDAQGNTGPNEAEIPEHLRPLAQSLANLPVPTPSTKQAVRIEIPAIEVDAPVVQGDGWEQLKKGVAQHPGSPNPGSNGNVVLSAHNDVYGELFRHLDRLEPGDVVRLHTGQQEFQYMVEHTQIVEPTAVDVMASTSTPTLTLISCYPYLVDSQRIVVFARLQN
jgi:sortase A